MNRAFLHSFFLIITTELWQLHKQEEKDKQETSLLSAMALVILCSTLPSGTANTGMSGLDFISRHDEWSTDFYSCPICAFRINVFVYYNNQMHNIHHNKPYFLFCTNCTYFI